MILERRDSEKIKSLILRGSVFIYPTDTIYGLGCDATNGGAVRELREIKEREEKPFSVIAPSKSWILENCVVKEDDLERLPGPYTLIARTRTGCVADNVNVGMETLGVRIPDHWFSQLVREIGKPVVTTSVNLAGQKFMTTLEKLDPKIKAAVDFIVYEGPLEGKPSKIINLATGNVKRG